MRVPRSTRERGQRETSSGGARALREDVPLRSLERLERRQATPREETDGAPDAAADSRLQQAPGGEELAGARRLELERLRQLRARPLERDDPEATTVFGRQVDAAELEVTRHVLQKVHELQSGADVVARRNERG